MRYKTYLVGGALRDELLGIPSKDLDYVVMAPSFAALREMLLEEGCKIFLETPKCNIIRAKHPTLGATDFALARKDGTYTDGRHPDSTTVTLDLKEDLARRDFTCNAMARDVETGLLIDPFNGQQDIKDRVIRCVGDPNVRLQEDRLRAFRALRFAVTKNMNILTSLSLAIRKLDSILDFEAVSTERIREELFKMFQWNWHRSFGLLCQMYPTLGHVVVTRNIWFQPNIKT